MGRTTHRGGGMGSKSLRDLPLDGEGPIYEQIYRALRAGILAGRVRSGARLPSTRLLADDLAVSRNTVLAAYDQLLAEGYVVGRAGAGTFVAPEIPEARPRPGPYPVADLGGGEPRVGDSLSRYGRALKDSPARRAYAAVLGREPLRFDFRPCVPDLERLPNETWRRQLSRTALDLPDSQLDYPETAGSTALRKELAEYLARARGVDCTQEQILIVGGVAQALDLSARLFVDPGDTVVVEEAHYLGARRVFEAAGARSLGVPVDEQGLRTNALPEDAKERCKLAYVTPSHQFPTGAVLSLTRRLELLRWAERSGAFVIEDDYDSEFRYSGRAIEALKSLDARGRVIYVGTFSKTLFPSLRIAYLVLPEPLVELFTRAKWLSDWASPPLEQAALADFIARGDFERHMRRARTLYGASRTALLDAIVRELGDTALFRDTHAGLHVHLRLPGIARNRMRELADRALEQEVAIYSAAPCYLEPPPEVELVMGFTRLEADEVNEGIARLGRLVRELRMAA